MKQHHLGKCFEIWKKKDSNIKNMRKIILLLIVLLNAIVSYGEINVQERIAEANKGDASAQASLVRYYYGNKEYGSCTEWAMTLVNNTGTNKDQRITANLYLGLLYANGEGVDKSRQMAISYLENGVKLESADCADILSQIYEIDSENRNLTKAFEWLKKSAELGDYQNAYSIAVHYEIGSGKFKKSNLNFPEPITNYQMAIKYYELYIENLPFYKPNPEHEYQRKRRHDPEIEYKIANAYFYGEIGVAPNYEKAIKYYNIFIDGNGDTNSYMKRGVTMSDQKLGEALWNLSTCYRFGRGVVKNELTARKLIRKAAEKGNEKAINFLNKEI